MDNQTVGIVPNELKSAIQKLRQIAFRHSYFSGGQAAEVFRNEAESALENLRQVAEGLPIAGYDSDSFAGLENALLRINDQIPSSDSEEDEITENDRVELDQAILNLKVSPTRGQRIESSETVSINCASTPSPAVSVQTL